jgi:hypothetical protein
MDLFLSIALLVLVIVNVWVYSYASEAKDETHRLWLRLDGQKQQLVEYGYRLHALEQKKGKKK